MWNSFIQHNSIQQQLNLCSCTCVSERSLTDYQFVLQALFSWPWFSQCVSQRVYLIISFLATSVSATIKVDGYCTYHRFLEPENKKGMCLQKLHEHVKNLNEMGSKSSLKFFFIVWLHCGKTKSCKGVPSSHVKQAFKWLISVEWSAFQKKCANTILIN